MIIIPKAFKSFKCTAQKCTDNCCIGWEVDIDRLTLEKYKQVGGELGKLLFDNITVSEDGSYCFKMTEGERCAFLDENNLCVIQKKAGEPMLCDICREHPRFYNELGDICECGFGLCCEEAVRLLFKSKGILPCEIAKPLTDEGEWYDSFENERAFCALNMRAKLFDELYNEKNGIFEVFFKCLEISQKAEKELFLREPYFDGGLCDEDILLSVAEDTEPIDENWLPLIAEMRKKESELMPAAKKLLEFYPERAVQYKRIFSYLLYRHIFPAVYDGEFTARTVFCIDCLRLQMMLDGFTLLKTNSFTERDAINNTKYLSRQIEYSSENTEMMMFL